MNLNILSYGIYGLITLAITVMIGREFHRNGYHYVRSIFKEKAMSQSVNNLLLIGYYLLNIGMVVYKISDWKKIQNTVSLIENISYSIAKILLLLGVMNIINIGVLSFFRKKKHLIN